MAKFYGRIGFALPDETRASVYEDEIVKRYYRGDVEKPYGHKPVSGENVNDDIRPTNVISILADPFAFQHFFAIRYVEWMGCLWKVSDVEVRHPRLVLTLGGVYHGPT